MGRDYVKLLDVVHQKTSLVNCALTKIDSYGFRLLESYPTN